MMDFMKTDKPNVHKLLFTMYWALTPSYNYRKVFLLIDFQDIYAQVICIHAPTPTGIGSYFLIVPAVPGNCWGFNTGDIFCCFGLRLYVPVDNFSVMSGRSHFLGITSTFCEVNVSCSTKQHGDPSEN